MARQKLKQIFFKFVTLVFRDLEHFYLSQNLNIAKSP